jgi:hypothetical protein
VERIKILDVDFEFFDLSDFIPPGGGPAEKAFFFAENTNIG